MTQTDSLSRKIAVRLFPQSEWGKSQYDEIQQEKAAKIIASELAEREKKVEEHLITARRALGGALRNGDWERVKQALSCVRAALSGLGVK